MKDFLHTHAAVGAACAPYAVPRLAALGVFDGVHLGHRRIIRRAAELAAACGAVPMAVSFSPHPRRLLTPENPPELLMPEAVRLTALYRAGAAETAFIAFTPEVAALTPEAFLEALAANRRFRIAGLCVGSRWRFGRGGAGDLRNLERFCAAHDWICAGVPELEIDGETVSSSAVRAAARCGDLDKVRRLTGEPLTLYGSVARGFQVAGTELAAPTANLILAAGVPPPDGVYAGSAEADGRLYPAAVNIGFSPTYHRSTRRIEAHLIGYSGTLYGKFLAVSLRRFLRPERAFPDPEALKRRIAADVAETLQIFKEETSQYGKP